MPLIQSAFGAIDLGFKDRVSGRRAQIRGIVIIICALVTAGVSFAVLIGLTPIQPDNKVTLVAIAVPAEGPSFGIAPAGTWIWMSLFSSIAGS